MNHHNFFQSCYKQSVIGIIFLGLATTGLNADIKDWFRRRGSSLKRGTQCAFAPKKYNCSKKERATARKWLIGSTVAAVTAGAAIGGAAVAYNQVQKAKEIAAAEEAAEFERQAELEKQRAEHEAKKEITIKQARAQGKSDEEIAALLAQQLAEEMGDFNETTPIEEPKSATARYFAKSIEVIKGGPKLLKEAFIKVKEQVRKGAIKTRDGIVQAYLKAVEFTNNLRNILLNSLGIALDKLQQGYAAVKEGFSNFVTILRNPRDAVTKQTSIQMKEDFSISVKNLVSYLNTLKEVSVKGMNAIKNLDKEALAGALTKTSETLSHYKEGLNRQMAEARERFNKFRTIEGKKAAEEKNKIEKFINKLEEKQIQYKLQEDFRFFANPKLWEERYRLLIERLNALNFKAIGALADLIGSGVSNIFKGFRYLHSAGGKVGALLFPETATMADGLRDLEKGTKSLGNNVASLLAINPIFTIQALSEIKVNWRELKEFGGKEKKLFVKGEIEALKNIANAANVLSTEFNILMGNMQKQFEWITNFKSEVIAQVKEALLQNKNIRNAAQILRTAVITALEKKREAMNIVIAQLSSIAGKVKELAPMLLFALQNINNSIQDILGKPFINQQFIQKINEIATINIPNINEGLKKIKEASNTTAGGS